MERIQNDLKLSISTILGEVTGVTQAVRGWSINLSLRWELEEQKKTDWKMQLKNKKLDILEYRFEEYVPHSINLIDTHTHTYRHKLAVKD